MPWSGRFPARLSQDRTFTHTSQFAAFVAAVEFSRSKAALMCAPACTNKTAPKTVLMYCNCVHCTCTLSIARGELVFLGVAHFIMAALS